MASLVYWTGSDPISGPVSEVANFLASLYGEGYQYNSGNAHRSAISSVHDKVDEVEVHVPHHYKVIEGCETPLTKIH